MKNKEKKSMKAKNGCPIESEMEFLPSLYYHYAFSKSNKKLFVIKLNFWPYYLYSMALKNDDDFMYIEVKPLLYVIVIATDIRTQ